VDEAASRVREEVDGDANIIFGATFDEGLEGIIRVSVVATGIEQERVPEQVAPPTAGMAELTRRLKSVGAPPLAATAQAHAQLQAQAQLPAQPAPQPQPQPQARRAQAEFSLDGLEQELANPAAVRREPQQAAAAAHRQAAAQMRPSTDPGVRIGPFRPDPSLIATRSSDYETEQVRVSDARAAAAANYIPPAAERPDSMQPRMPRVEDFPPVAQRQLRAQQSPSNIEEERRPRGLLARLASGLARHAEAAHESHRDEPRVVASQQAPHPAITPAAEFKPQPRRMGEGAAAAGSLDPRGRPVLIDQGRDDHLEIPAFLRRQSS
jgi:cell division protein FtsZ